MSSFLHYQRSISNIMKRVGAVWEQRLVVSATQETEAEHGSNLEVWSGEQDHINK